MRTLRLPLFSSSRPASPRTALTVPAGGLAGPVELQTEDVPYAAVTVCGLVVSVHDGPPGGEAIGLVDNLRTGGSGNLLLHDGPAPAAMYNVDDDSQITGLRLYPVMRSPNRAKLTVSASGPAGATVALSCCVVAEVL